MVTKYSKKKASKKASKKKSKKNLIKYSLNRLSDDYCKGEFSKDCEGNLNISRINMPQILDYPLGNIKNLKKILLKQKEEAKKKILLKMSKNGYDKDTVELLRSTTNSPLDYVVKKFNAKKKQVPIKKVIPIQKEIRKSMTRFIIDMESKDKFINHKSYKSGSILNAYFLTICFNNKIYILDGHHRWSAIRRIYPDEKINTYEIKSRNIIKTINDINKLPYVYNEQLSEGVNT